MATGNPVKHAAQRLALPSDWRPARLAFRGQTGPQKAGHGKARKQANWRLTYRAWRQTRPFWGGLLLVIGGLELLALPLSGILSRGAVRLVVYIGIGGVFGVLIGILLITAGIAVWVSPAHRVFYGIAGIVMGIASFPTSNLGGFFLCMLLSIIGGSIAVAWAPDAVVVTGTAGPAPAEPPAAPAELPTKSAELPATPVELPTALTERPTAPAEPVAGEQPADEQPDGERPAGEQPDGEAPAARP